MSGHVYGSDSSMYSGVPPTHYSTLYSGSSNNERPRSLAEEEQEALYEGIKHAAQDDSYLFQDFEEPYNPEGDSFRIGSPGYAVRDDGSHVSITQDESISQRVPSAYAPSTIVADPTDLGGIFDEKGDISMDGTEWNEKSMRQEDDEDRVLSPFMGQFGPPPVEAQLRRNKTKRRIKLTDGNLVLDCMIPSRLMGFLPRKDAEEFRYSRYTAVTGGPEGFNSSNFTLRSTLYDRRTELLIVVTMYNEDEVLFTRTMHGIMQNISHLCTRTKSKTWGEEAWKKIVVCVVADGRKAIHPRVLDCMAAMGVYQEGVAKNRIDDKNVTCHLYEYTTQLSVDPNLKFKGMEKGIVPTQILFCLKDKNAKKINSHRWALEAFAPQLMPNIVMLIDVGTLPGPKSLYRLWKTFDLNSNVAGAAGEICTMKGKFWSHLLNPLVAAQNFEYKISNILDKPLESIFGYIGVLPGAFSAYRYRALLNDSLGHGPLASYFKGEHLAGYDADVFTSNMYLAEDRILCWELVAKANENWVLKYVKSAQGETDVPDSIAEFIGQRRRWLNGSFFASTYSLVHFFQIMKTNHSIQKKVAFIFQALYNVFSLLFAWFGLGNYYCFFMILTSSLEDPNFNLKGIKVANTFMQYTYMGVTIASFVFSMGNKPKANRWKYMSAIILYGMTTAYMLGAAGFCIYKALQQISESAIFAQIVISILSTYGVYVVGSLIALDPWHLITCMLQYMLLSPIYINLLNIYAFSNLHDFSWGTKDHTSQEIDLGVAQTAGKDVVDVALPTGQSDIDDAYNEALERIKTRPMILARTASNKEKEDQVREYYAGIRTNVLLAWVLSNALLAAFVLEGNYKDTFTSNGNGRTQIFLLVVLICVAAMSAIRFFGAVIYYIMWTIDLVA